jgi:hypothetical protein
MRIALAISASVSTVGILNDAGSNLATVTVGNKPFGVDVALTRAQFCSLGYLGKDCSASRRPGQTSTAVLSHRAAAGGLQIAITSPLCLVRNPCNGIECAG